MEDTARLGMLVQAVAVGFHLAQWEGRTLYRRLIRPCLLTACLAAFLLVSIIIPKGGNFINFYNILTELVSVGGWLLLCACAVGAVRQGRAGASFLAGGCCALGVGYLTNLLNSNRFEPIRGLWQMEYAGFCMVLLFGGLILSYHRALLLQNRKLLLHMEELVQQRTAELGTVLEERKNFFSHMAHNLKAPIAAVHGFIGLIRESNLYLDEELQTYIRLIEDENTEMSQRVQSLSKLNAFDRITTPRVVLEVDELLTLIEQKNAPEVDVAGIHFTVGYLGTSAKLMAQREKLLILFENLIYNAISFTSA
ncbi:MAG: histidine kinase dimerization/phospho-acceptor domain-containing protein, partial [Oscillospiraceae bacterium]